MTVRCPNCGAEEPDEADFCSACGSQLRGSVTGESVPVSSVQPAPGRGVEGKDIAPHAPMDRSVRCHNCGALESGDAGFCGVCGALLGSVDVRPVAGARPSQTAPEPSPGCSPPRQGRGRGRRRILLRGLAAAGSVAVVGAAGALLLLGLHVIHGSISVGSMTIGSAAPTCSLDLLGSDRHWAIQFTGARARHYCHAEKSAFEAAGISTRIASAPGWPAFCQVHLDGATAAVEDNVASSNLVAGAVSDILIGALCASLQKPGALPGLGLPSLTPTPGPNSTATVIPTSRTGPSGSPQPSRTGTAGPTPNPSVAAGPSPTRPTRSVTAETTATAGTPPLTVTSSSPTVLSMGSAEAVALEKAVLAYHVSTRAAYGPNHDTSSLPQRTTGMAAKAVQCLSSLMVNEKAYDTYNVYDWHWSSAEMNSDETYGIVEQYRHEQVTTHYPDKVVPAAQTYTAKFALTKGANGWRVLYYWPSSDGSAVGASADANGCPTSSASPTLGATKTYLIRPANAAASDNLSTGWAGLSASCGRTDARVYIAGGNSISFAFVVPSGESAAVSWITPAGGQLNQDTALITVDGGPAAKAGASAVGGFYQEAQTRLTLWQQTFGPGRHQIDWKAPGGDVNIYGLDVKGPIQPVTPRHGSPACS